MLNYKSRCIRCWFVTGGSPAAEISKRRRDGGRGFQSCCSSRCSEERTLSERGREGVGERRKRCSFITSSWGKCREGKLGLFESGTLWLPVPKPSEDHHPPVGTTESTGSMLQAWKLAGALQVSSPHWTTKDWWEEDLIWTAVSLGELSQGSLLDCSDVPWTLSRNQVRGCRLPWLWQNYFPWQFSSWDCWTLFWRNHLWLKLCSQSVT